MKSIAIAAVLFALTAGSAHAFTYDGQSNLNSDGSTKFTDPGEQLSDGTAKKKSKSGFSMSFSGGQTNPGFGGQNRFLPSSNRAFSSPFDQQSNFGSPGNN